MQGNSRGISSSLAKMTVIPIVLYGIVVSIFGIFWVKSSMEDEVEHELKTNAYVAVDCFESLYPGDYAVDSSNEELQVTKGDTILNSNYSIIDALQKDSDAEYTLFLGNIRVQTTLTTDDGMRIIGTECNDRIYEDVFQGDADHFYKQVDLLGQKYYAYYTPLHNADGTCVGMIASLITANVVMSKLIHAILPLIILIIIGAIFAIIWSHKYANDISLALRKLQQSFRKVSEGTLSHTVAPEMLARKDEIGDMAHSVVDMQAALRKLVDEDMLTGLSNRRSGQLRLTQMLESETPFCIALGDIDFFKKFNDTYGHDCGDIVLCMIAATLKKQVQDYGICCRWGGEEFLIIFSRGDFDELKEVMNNLINAVRNLHIPYGNTNLSVTMTFGLINTSGMHSTDEMLKKVDNLLYQGKENGRNQLVT